MENTQLQLAIERIAKMDHAGVSVSEIATACNLPVDKLIQIQDTEKYKSALADIAAEAFDKTDVLNGGWDMVENLAMNKVVEHLQRAPDPDYALRAAALANKAVRRGKHVNAPIGQQPNEQAIINVSVSFAETLQDNFVIEQKPVADLQKKDNNFLAPKKVAQLLGNSKYTKEVDEQQQIADELGDMGDLVPAY